MTLTPPPVLDPLAIYTRAEVAALLRVSLRTVDTLPIPRRGVGRQVRYLGRNVLRYLEGADTPAPRRLEVA